MTQLPFVPPTSVAPAAYGTPYYDHHQQYYHHDARAGPQAGEVAVPAGSAPLGGGAALGGVGSSVQHAPAYAPYNPSGATPTYPSGGPVPLTSSSLAHPSASTAPPPAHDALAAHHRSLVAYYWLYAQQGYAAPLTALEGTVERAQQERARTEAVDWARSCGIVVVDPATSAPASASAQPYFAHALASEPQRARTVSRPLPSAPAGSAAGPAASGSGRPLPSPAAPVPSSSAPPVIAAAAQPPTRSPLPAVPAPPARRSTLPDPPAPSLPPASPSSADDTPPLAASASHKRPLPLPPLGQLAAELDSMSISGSASQDSAAELVPSIVLPGEAPVAPAAAPPVPTFSFSGGDEDDEDDPPASAPAVPTFSFGGPDADAPPSAPAPPPRRRAAPLHPRHDPSHPSHKLYHPTSVLPSSSSSTSPIPSSSAATATATSHALPEAGTLTCTACASLIFGRVLVALGREWHPDCFRCAEDGCGARLEVMEFEGTPEDWEGGKEEEGEGEGEGEGESEKAGEDLRGKAWCMVHFEERFALECYQCRTPIASADYLPLSDPLLPPRASYRHPSTRFYHPLHFFCAGCGDPFVDPVSYELQGAGELEACPYVARDGHPYCDRCDLRMWRPKCAGCRKGLREEDGFLEVEGDKWHEGCFQCSMCAKPLNGIYLLRREAPPPAPSSAADATTDSDADDIDELPFCAECYDIKAKEEAEAALAAAR